MIISNKALLLLMLQLFSPSNSFSHQQTKFGFSPLRSCLYSTVPPPKLILGSKSQFPIFNPDPTLTYLDTAATSQKPQSVLDSLTKYYTTTNANVHRGGHVWGDGATDGYEKARKTVAEFVTGSSLPSDGVVFTSGMTAGLNAVAWGMEVSGFLESSSGEVDIILTIMDHHSNIVPWEIIKRERERIAAIYNPQGDESLSRAKINIHYIPLRPDGYTLDLEFMKSILQKNNTKVVSFVHASNTLGTINPVDEIIDTVREFDNNHEIAIILDASQSAPHSKIINNQKPDFVLFSGHKLLGPTGIGCIFSPNGASGFKKFLPLPSTGGGEMIDFVKPKPEGGGLQIEYANSAPRLYESGTPNIADVFGFATALEVLMATEIGEIHEYLKTLTESCAELLEKEIDGVRILGPKRGEERAPLVSFVIPGIHCQDLATFLNLDGIMVRTGFHCTEPLHHVLGINGGGGSLRASFGVYNDMKDVKFFVEKLKETVETLRFSGKKE